MTNEQWNELKHGDKIRFIGKWNERHIGDIDVIYVDHEGNKYIDSEGDSIFPLWQFDPEDWEKVVEK